MKSSFSLSAFDWATIIMAGIAIVATLLATVHTVTKYKLPHLARGPYAQNQQPLILSYSLRKICHRERHIPIVLNVISIAIMLFAVAVCFQYAGLVYAIPNEEPISYSETPVRPSSYDIHSRIEYPAETSYLLSYESFYVKANEENGAYLYSRPDCSPDYVLAVLHDKERVIAFAKEDGFACVTVTSTGEQGWVNSNILITDHS